MFIGRPLEVMRRNKPARLLLDRSFIGDTNVPVTKKEGAPELIGSTALRNLQAASNGCEHMMAYQTGKRLSTYMVRTTS